MRGSIRKSNGWCTSVVARVSHKLVQNTLSVFQKPVNLYHGIARQVVLSVCLNESALLGGAVVSHVDSVGAIVVSRNVLRGGTLVQSRIATPPIGRPPCRLLLLRFLWQTSCGRASLSALWKDIRFTSERHLRYIVEEGENNNENKNKLGFRWGILSEESQK